MAETGCWDTPGGRRPGCGQRLATVMNAAPASRVERRGVIRCMAGALPGKDVLRTKGWRLALRAAIRNLNPGYFALVMGYRHRVAGDEPDGAGRLSWIPAR